MNLAEKMSPPYRIHSGEDIQNQFTGLRQQLYEDLSNEENTIRRIIIKYALIAKVREYKLG